MTASPPSPAADRTPPVVLVVAGIDSSGGAGLHADLRALAAHRVHAASAIAALTAQSTLGISGLHVVPASFVAAQIDAVCGDLHVRATKTGFLASADTVGVVAEAAAKGRLGHVVVDPVLVDAAGRPLFDDDVTDAYRRRLLGHARVITPNRVEAGVLVGRDVVTVADMERAARELLELGCEVVVVKGGDAADEGDDSIDVVASAGGVDRLVAPRVDTGNDHGSGCTFAAATAAGLARGQDPVVAVGAAKRFVHRALIGARSWRLGAGHGPVDALGWADRPDST